MNEKHEKERTEEFEKFRDNNPDVDTQSVWMLESKKVQILEDIFEHLDSNKSGSINMDNLNLDTISADMLKFFDPIFEEI